MRDLEDSDHCGLQCKNRKGKIAKRRRRQSASAMKDDRYWEEIQHVSDDKMKATIEMMNNKEDIEGKWKALKIIVVLKAAKTEQ